MIKSEILNPKSQTNLPAGQAGPKFEITNSKLFLCFVLRLAQTGLVFRISDFIHHPLS